MKERSGAIPAHRKAALKGYRLRRSIPLSEAEVNSDNKKEDVFAKLFKLEAMIDVYSQCPGTSWLTIFLFLSHKLRYNKTYIYLTIDDIAERCNCAKSMAHKVLTVFESSQLIVRKGRGELAVNPNLLFVGDSEVRKQLCCQWEKENRRDLDNTKTTQRIIKEASRENERKKKRVRKKINKNKEESHETV